MGIHKVPKNLRRQKVEQPKVLGAGPLKEPGETRIVDHRTKSKPVEIQTKVHGEPVTVQSHVRSKPRKKSDPDVRLRAMTREDREAWNKARNVEWEDE